MTARSTQTISKTEIWRKRLEAFKTFKGSASEFCEQEGVSTDALAYWRQKAGEIPLAPSRSKMKWMRTTSTRSPIKSDSPQTMKKRNPFSKAEIIHETTQPTVSPSFSLDPRWVAEFLVHLQTAQQKDASR